LSQTASWTKSLVFLALSTTSPANHQQRLNGS